jgi:archaellum component FlaC
VSFNITETTDGVTFHKYIEEEEYGHTAIVYEFDSSRGMSVDVELEESIPGGLEAEHIGFHPDYGSEAWDIGDRKLQFESEMDPEATNTSVLAVLPEAPGSTTDLLTSPAEFSVEAPEIENLASNAGTVSSAASTDGGKEVDKANQPVDALQQQTDIDEQIPEIDLGPATGDNSDPDGEETTVAGEEPQVADDGTEVVHQLVSAIEAGAISEDDRQILREEFGVTKNSVDARIEHLQSELADLGAYIDALEEFIDEHGDGDEIIEGFKQELEAQEASLDSLDDRVDRFEPRVTAIEDTVEVNAREVDSVSSAVSQVEEQLSDFSSDLDELDRQIRNDDLERRVANMEKELADVTDFISQMKDAFD